jgi:hypothetical protein
MTSAKSNSNVAERDEGLRRNAAGIEAIAAHLVLLDQRHLRLHRRRDVRGDEACGAGPDDDDVAVELRRPWPLRIDLARLDRIERLLRHERKDAEQHEREDEARGNLERAELRARVHVHDRPREHAELAHPVEGARRDRREPHHEIDHEERKRRHQPQREEIERAFACDALVDRLQLVAELALHPIAQDEARR